MMFSINSMGQAAELFREVQNPQMFSSTMYALQKYMKSMGMDSRYLLELEKHAYYLKNEYSEKDTREHMEEAKNRVIAYIEGIIDNNVENEKLTEILENFYLFLENLIERTPHKLAGIQRDQLANLKIKNEYDIQHLLYAFLKPLYPMARTEVNEDMGYSVVRTDIFLDENHVIEVKYTRETTRLKKLIEEIEADMVHYHAKNIYFFLYDKAKIIENPLAFKQTYVDKVKDKQIHIIIHQEKKL